MEEENMEREKELQQEIMEKEMHAKFVEQEKQRALQSKFEPKVYY